MREYAVYKGEELLAIGTSKECAKQLNVLPSYIRWLNTPTAKRRLATRKNPHKCVVGFVLKDGD
ncbi:hypothetical protein ACFOZ1_06645 [Gracilibacillus marinus]|uniref:DNA-binding protein n=1 Tax=Gracilibacillus marinus TaxID=630535 RepID=A0ABV8VWT6_9BACI